MEIDCRRVPPEDAKHPLMEPGVATPRALRDGDPNGLDALPNRYHRLLRRAVYKMGMA